MILGPEGSEAFTVRQVPTAGIELRVDGEPRLKITVGFKCSFDGSQQFLAVHSANFKVFATESSDPLFRYEFERSAPDDMAAAHIQIHAHRDALSYAMARCGTATRRGKQRAKHGEAGAMKALHFPVGGSRFRPCLEDVLEMLIHEFGVDHPAEALGVLRKGRETWRRTQLKSAVRDSPDDAVEALRDMGYTVRRKRRPKDNVVSGQIGKRMRQL